MFKTKGDGGVVFCWESGGSHVRYLVEYGSCVLFSNKKRMEMALQPRIVNLVLCFQQKVIVVVGVALGALGSEEVSSTAPPPSIIASGAHLHCSERPLDAHRKTSSEKVVPGGKNSGLQKTAAQRRGVWWLFGFHTMGPGSPKLVLAKAGFGHKNGKAKVGYSRISDGIFLPQRCVIILLFFPNINEDGSCVFPNTVNSGSSVLFKSMCGGGFCLYSNSCCFDVLPNKGAVMKVVFCQHEKSATSGLLSNMNRSDSCVVQREK